MPNLKISELTQRTPDGTEFIEVIIPPFAPGDNRKVLLSDLSAILGGTVPDADATTKGIVELATPAEVITGTSTTLAVTPEGVKAVSDLKVDEETFATLTFASPTVWDCNSRQSPLAKVTATGNFTIDMTNVKSGASGILKIIANTASAFVLTFDTSFTNKDLVTGVTLVTYTFPANNAFEYINSFIVDGTTIYWSIGDFLNPAITNPFAEVSRAASQANGNNDITVAVSFDTEVYDNAAIFDVGQPTRLTIPGSGNKIASLSFSIAWATNTTGIRRVWFYKNGVANGYFQIAPNASVTTVLAGTYQLSCVGGDYFELIPYQNSGGALNITMGANIKIESR